MMKDITLNIEKDRCYELACELFVKSAGVDRDSPKLDVRVSCKFYDHVEISGREATIGGHTFTCKAFELLDEGTLKGAYVYALTIGDCKTESESTSERLYEDIWGTSYIDAARIILKDQISQYSSLSDNFGPGFYGMDLSEIIKIDKLLGLQSIGIELLSNNLMAPAKSFSGIYFSVTKEYKGMKANCINCIGSKKNCVLCMHNKTVGVDNKKAEMIQYPADFVADQGGNGYGIAFDIGTTTVVGVLRNIQAGEVVGAKAKANPQRKYGRDIISRISFADMDAGNTEILRSLLIDTLNLLSSELCIEHEIASEEVRSVVICGNTVMSHIFIGHNPISLARAPFTPSYEGTYIMNQVTSRLNVNQDAEVKVLPAIDGHVGGDITAGIIATRLLNAKSLTLFVDLGTNGEIVLTDGSKTLACSTAAGPVFEGAGTYGSGLIDMVSKMLNENIIDRTGKLTEKYKGEYIFEDQDEDVVVTQKNIRDVQLAKGAISAGIEILLKHMGKTTKDIDKVLVAGAFGSYINKDSAVNIGLLPDIGRERIVFAGNSAGAGASMALASKKEAECANQVPGLVYHIELADDEDFQEIYLDAMSF
jgi:hypothetical protein